MVWCDGKFVEETEFRVSPFDRGLCHGFSFFETILAVDGKPKLLTEHLSRLQQGLARVGVNSVGLSKDGLEAAMILLLGRNGLEKGMAKIRLSVSLGRGPLDLADSGEAWAWMVATGVTEVPTPIRLTTAPWRLGSESVLRGLKVGSYAENLVAMDMARREGFDEMLFYNTSDELCEGAMANVFLIRRNVLSTPGLDSGCLAGITRELIVWLAGQHRLRCRQGPLRKADVRKADCIFLTSSVRGPVQVGEFEGKIYGQSPVFDVIRKAWLEAMRGK